MRTLRILFVSVFLAVVLVWAPLEAHAGPMPKRWHAPSWFLRQALCIHHYEGAWNAATGNGYEGGLQFLASTWIRAGGRIHRSGHWASVASPREQIYRAWIITRSHGGSWSEWGTAGMCGLR